MRQVLVAFLEDLDWVEGWLSSVAFSKAFCSSPVKKKKVSCPCFMHQLAVNIAAKNDTDHIDTILLIFILAKILVPPLKQAPLAS